MQPIPSDAAIAQRLLARAATLLSASTDYRDTLAQALAAALPDLGDFGFFDAPTPGGEVVRIVRAHDDAEIEALLRPTRWVRNERTDLNPCALSSGEAALHADIDDAWYRAVAANDGHLEMLRRLAFRSMISVPMRHRGELIGALTLFMGRSGRRHGPMHLEAAQALAGVASPAVANAGLLEALRASEAQLRMAVKAGKIGLWAWNLADSSVYWSPEYRAIYGIGADEPPSFARGIGSVVPDDVPAIQAAMTQALATHGEFATRHRVRLPDGSERWIRSLGRPEYGADGKPERVTGVVIDVTERERTERELAGLRERLSEELSAIRRLHEISARRMFRDENMQDLLREILDAALDITGRERGVIQLTEGDVLRVVASRNFDERFIATIREIPREAQIPSALAWRLAERVVVDDLAADPRFSATPGGQILLAGGIRAVQSTPLVARSGTVIGALTTHDARVHRWEERELRLLDLLSREAADIIDRARAEAALQEADRRKDEFLAILAHELRNPLAPIRYAVSIARERASTEAQRVQAEHVIERQVAHMGRLLDDLLDVSRIARGKVELKRERIALRAVVAPALEAARPLCTARGHHLELAGTESDVLVEGDPVRLTQILTNLLNNAAKYTEPGGRIVLTVTVEGGDVEIRVADNGIGIAPELRPRLFTLFSQAEGAAQRAEGGLGIGLALVKGFVELHGGTVEVAPNPAGRGSEFRVRLPGIAATARAAMAAPAASTHPRALRVLVADDNRDICDMCATLLELWGHEPLVAGSGAEALETLRRERPHVAILDLGMPGMTGYEVAEAARAELGSGIVLIAVTGWGQDEAKARTARAGFDHHLTKPVEVDALQALIARAGAGAASAAAT